MGRVAVAAVLIDLDGTLWDSAPWFARLLAPTDRGEQHRLALALSDQSGGLRAAQQIKERFTQSAFGRVCRSEAASLLIYPSGPDTLRELEVRVRLGVVTNLPAWIARPMLDAIGLLDAFTVVQCAAWGVRPKPSPATLLLAQRQLVVPAADVLYVGDTQSDHAAATAARMTFVYASWGYENIVDAPLQIDDWSQLLALT
jgi:phosphoglycolate phosphatase